MEQNNATLYTGRTRDPARPAQHPGLPATAIAAHDSINAGLSAGVLRDIAGAVSLDEITLCRMAGIDRNTYSRRLNSAEKRFSPEQSARVYTLARVISAARELFEGDSERMATWLNKPAKGLGGKNPQSFSRPRRCGSGTDIDWSP
jgi:putative toxin-antitoxin system antitoxin component (TIGR02293 family)